LSLVHCYMIFITHLFFHFTLFSRLHINDSWACHIKSANKSTPVTIHDKVRKLTISVIAPLTKLFCRATLFPCDGDDGNVVLCMKSTTLILIPFYPSLANQATDKSDKRQSVLKAPTFLCKHTPTQ